MYTTDEQLKTYLNEIKDINEKALKEHSAFLDRLLILVGTLFGILLSLFPKNGLPLECSYSFLFGISFLSIGILSLSVARFRIVSIYRNLWTRSLDEVIRANMEIRQPISLLPEYKKSFSIFEIVGYICLIASLMSFVVYVFLCIVT